MRKHFLILMLLALLPFTAWAADPGVNVTAGVYTVNINKQIMTTAAAPEVNFVNDGTDNVSFTVASSYRYQTIGHKVSEISAEGLYFLEVSLTGANTVLYVPFYVAGELNATLVNTKDLYDASLAEGGAYWYYYQEWKRSDVWYRWNLSLADTEENGVLLYPGDVPAPTSGNPAQVDITQRLDPNSSNYNQNANAWYDALKAGAYKNNISHSWWAAMQSKPANYAFSFHTAAADEAWKVAVSYDNAPVVFPWGDRVFGSQDGQKHYGLYSVDGPVLADVDIYHNFNVNPANFVASKFKMYLVPATLPAGVEAPVVSNVEVTLDPNVINVLYPDNVGGVVPAVKASDFSIQAGSTFPTGIKDAAEAKASLIASEILKIQTVEDKPIPALLGSVKYYFDIDQDKLAASVWAGASIHVAKNGDLNVIARPLNDETVFITADPTDAAYDAQAGYSYEFDATYHQPKPFVTIGAYDPAVTTNRLVEGTDFEYTWSFNKNVNDVRENPANAETAGTPTVTISAKAGSGYTGSATFQFAITPKAFNNNVTISAIAAQTYKHGDAITPEFTVTDADLNGYEMIEGRDYNNVVWDKNIDATGAAEADKASVTISPVGNYQAGTTPATATAVRKFIINPKNINDAEIVFAGVVDKTYNYGEALEQNLDPNAGDVMKLQWGATAQAAAIDIPAIFDYTYANNINVGIATITAKIKTDLTDPVLIAAAKNYTADEAGKTKTFQILPRKLTDVEGLKIIVSDAVYNEGDPVTPTITVTRTGTTAAIELNPETEYEISGWENNINVTPNGATWQQKAKVTIIGKGNYAAVDAQANPITKSQRFVIGKKPVVLTAVGPTAAKPYGTSEADFGFTYTTNLNKTAVAEFLNTFGGHVTYAPYSNEDVPSALTDPFNALSVGTYKVRATWASYNDNPLSDAEIAAKEAAHQPYDTEAQINARANYNFAQTANVFGTFTIGDAALTIVPQAAEKFYGVTADPGLNYIVKNSAGATVNVTGWTVAPHLTREAGTNAGEYEIKVDNTPELPNFTLNYDATAIFTIKKFPITITVNPQTILFGSAPNLNSDYTDMVRTVVNNVEQYDPNMTTVTITPTQLADQTIIDRGDDGLGLTLTWDKTVVGNNGVYEKAIKAEITSGNYDATINHGTLTIKNDAPAITLVRVARDKVETAENTAASYIEQYDGKTVTVNIKFNDADAYNTLKPNKWYAMILPFETTAKQISDAFGYAIVDLLNTANTNEHRTLFSLHMSTEVIPANTPFIIKVWDTINMNATGVTFNGVTIEAPVNPEDATAYKFDEIAVSDKAGNKFIGSYTGINNLGAYKEGYNGHTTWWSLNQDAEYDNNAVPVKATSYLRQLSAFNFIKDDPAAHEIVIEELGGGTTVIRGINADAETFSGEGWYNLNGVKLQNVPAEKGVYIQNGKKVVIK